MAGHTRCVLHLCHSSFWRYCAHRYFVNPATVWSQVMNWEFSFSEKAGIIGVAIYMFLSSMIIRHTLCKYVCSAG